MTDDPSAPDHECAGNAYRRGRTDGADAILDWLDADEVAREFGAESEYYQTLDRPYRSANAVPGSLTELLYVKGVTRTLLHGIASGNMALNSDSGSASTSQPA